MDNTNLKSWFIALFSVIFLWGINNVLLGVGAKALGGNAILYSCTAFTTGALVLLLYAGPGALGKETMRSIDTWVYGITLLIGYSLSFILYTYVSSTEGTLLQRLSVVISLFISWFFLSRKPSLGQLGGAGLIIFGVALIVKGIAPQTRLVVYAVMILFAVFQAMRIFAAEYHRPHITAAKQSATDPKGKARVVGFVMFMISTLFAFITFLFAVAQSSVPADEVIKGLPTLQDFTHTENILLGLAAGGIILAPLLLIEFKASYEIKTENYLALTSLAALSTWFWEWLTSPLTGLALTAFSKQDMIACFLITAGGASIALLKLKKKKTLSEKTQEALDINPQDLDAMSDTREVIAASLEHFNADIEKTAKALQIEPDVVSALLADKDKILAFKPEVLKKVARAYRRNVAGADALTGLANRSTFMQALKNAPIEADIYSVLFIDLNKFKPVNDTYGHEAGDAILRGVAERLKGIFPKRSLSCRLGGDEFCVLLLDTNKEDAQRHAQKATTALNTPFEVQYKTITVGAAVGIASAPEDGTDGETLLKCADKNMYKDKAER